MTTILFISEWSDPDIWKKALEEVIPDLDFRVWPDVGDPDEVELALVWKAPLGFYSRFPNLRGIISLGAGVDHLFRDPGLPDDMPLARVVDPNLERMMSEFVLTCALYYHRDLDHFAAAQEEKVWAQTPAVRTSDRTIGILGAGELGGGAARVLKSQGFDVQVWSRRAKSFEGIRSYVEEDLETFLGGSKILVNLLPLTGATRRILNQQTLAKLPRGACVINVGRGAHVDETALLGLLDSGYLRGAFLDAFDTEPLPREHPFWSHPKVKVTPHVAAHTDPSTAAALVRDNLQRLRQGQPMRYSVTRFENG